MTPAQERAAVGRAKALRHEGDLKQAEAAIASLLSIRPKSRSGLTEGAYLAWYRKDWTTAVERYCALLAFHPEADSLKVHVRIARGWMHLHRPGRASKALAIARETFPDNAQLVMLGSQADIARGAGERALRYVLPYIAASGIDARRIHAALHRLFFRRGHVSEAYRIKAESARVYAQASRPRNPRAKLQRAAAHGYLGDFATGHDLVVTEPYDRWPRPENAEQFRRYCELMMGRDAATVFRELYDAEGENPDTAPTRPGEWGRDDFRSHIQGRSIAIVGPADTRQELREEIDAFDIVVRNNVFSASDLDYSAEMLGRRVDIAYYTSATFARRRAELIDFARSSGIIPVLRRVSNLKDTRSEGVLNARICSPSPPNFLPNFHSMHSVQRIAWDLLKFGPSRVKLFNLTFYAGSMYSPGYMPRKKAPSLTSLGISHDPLQGFRFTRNLRRLGVIECDPVATDILEWPEERYLDLLQRDYADHWRPPRRTPAAT